MNYTFLFFQQNSSGLLYNIQGLMGYGVGSMHITDVILFPVFYEMVTFNFLTLHLTQDPIAQTKHPVPKPNHTLNLT